MTDQPVDIGHDHTLLLRYFKGEASAVEIGHTRPEGGPCSAEHVPFTGRAWAREFDGRITTWEVIADSPLTLSPSILCRACGDHGFVRAGRWEKA